MFRSICEFVGTFKTTQRRSAASIRSITSFLEFPAVMIFNKSGSKAVAAGEDGILFSIWVWGSETALHNRGNPSPGRK